MNGWSERRLFLISAGALASCSISLRLLTRASAQTLAFTASDPGSLSKLVETTPQWQAMVADVAFFHSWRLELRPLDYEGRPDFVQEMAQNRAQIFGARPQFISLLAQAGPGLMAERENFISVYNQRRERYERFLAACRIPC